MIEIQDPITAEYLLIGLTVVWEFTCEHPVIIGMSVLWVTLIVFCVDYKTKVRIFPKEW
jgi:uncharacterized membrane protein YuzA (DUF378 family)